MSLPCWSSLGAIPHCPWERLGASCSQETPVCFNQNNNYYYCLCFREKLSTLQPLLKTDKISG